MPVSPARPPGELDRELRARHGIYYAADDLPGAADCTSARAVTATAAGGLPAARAFLQSAQDEHAWERADRDPLPSGAALLAVLGRILDRADRSR